MNKHRYTQIKKDRFTQISVILNKCAEYSLYSLLFFIPFSKTLIEISAIIAISAWALKKIFLGKAGLTLVKTDLNAPLFAFYMISLLSIFYSTYPAISLRAFLTKTSEYVLLYFAIVETIDTKRAVRNMAVALALSLFIVCADGLYQRFVGTDFIRGYNMYGLKTVSIDGIYHTFTQFDSPYTQTIKGQPLNQLVRITASFNFPNGFSTYLLITVLPFIALATFHKEDLRIRVASLILAVLAAYSLFLTYTRGAYFSFTLALVSMFLLARRETSPLLFLIIIGGIAAVMLTLPADLKLGVDLKNIFTTDSSGLHRVRMWTTGWNMFMDRPFLGQGLNTFMANYEKFKVPYEPVGGKWYAHNCYLQIAAETGIFGLVSFLWLAARMIRDSVRSWRRIDDDFLRYAYLGLFFGVFSFLIHIFVEMSLYSLQLAALFFFSLGLLSAIRKIGLNYGKI